MSESLVRHVVAADPESLLALSLEDLAYCQACYQQHREAGLPLDGLEELPARIAAWTADKSHVDIQSEGARQQPLLRRLLDALRTRGPEGLARDELEFLSAAHGLITRSRLPRLHKRAFDRLHPHYAAIESARGGLPPLPALPNLARQVRIVTEEDVASARPREIRAFAGLPEAVRGPLIEHDGVLKVVGDVPDGATVIAAGACHITGYVLGRVLGGANVEVGENIGGLAISQKGNIRARALVNRARAIAKRGRVTCRSAQDPALVYAAGGVKLREGTRLGTFFASRADVGGVVAGGRWHINVSMRAGEFAGAPHTPLDIVLRESIGFEDFGVQLPGEAHTLLRRANRLKGRIEYLEQLRDRQTAEAEHYASAALASLFGGSGAQETLQAIETLKRRRSFLVRIMTGLHLLTRSVADRMRVASRKTLAAREAQEEVQRAIQRSLAEVTRELAEFKDEGEFPQELDREWEDLVALHTGSVATAAEDALSRAILRFHESRKAWQEEVMQLDDAIAARQSELAEGAVRKELLSRAQSAGAAQPALLQIVRAAKERGPADPVAKRLDAPFVRRMIGLLEKRNTWAGRYDAEAKENQSEWNRIRERLHANFHLDLAAQQSEARVEGHFGGDVRLHPGEFQVSDRDPAGNRLVVNPPAENGPAAYVLRDGAILRLEHD